MKASARAYSLICAYRTRLSMEHRDFKEAFKKSSSKKKKTNHVTLKFISDGEFEQRLKTWLERVIMDAAYDGKIVGQTVIR